MPRQRLDQLVVDRNLSESREKAQRLIRAGLVRVKGQTASKPGHLFPDDSEVSVDAQALFVSRGGDKLQGAFEAFGINVETLVCLDVGSSTGGFTDCMLQHGAARVYAVDVGTSQLHWKLRNDPRVVVMENVNARYLKPAAFPEQPAFATIDVSFISLTKVMGAVTDVIRSGARIVSLIKPQFEAGPRDVEKGGVVRRPEVRERVIGEVRSFGTGRLGLEWLGIVESPLKGPAGNTEYLAYWHKK